MYIYMRACVCVCVCVAQYVVHRVTFLSSPTQDSIRDSIREAHVW